MNKLSIVLCFLLISSFNFAKISVKGFIKENLNGITSGEILEEYREKTLNGEQLEYEDGNLKYKYYYENGERLPKYYEYYPDGSIKISNEMEISYEEDTKISNGTYIEYDENGKITKKEQYKNNKLTGEYIGEDKQAYSGFIVVNYFLFPHLHNNLNIYHLIDYLYSY